MNNQDKSYSKKYYNANREKILSYQREYYRNKKQMGCGRVSIKHGKFLLFGKKPCIINWDEPCECVECNSSNIIEI